MAKTFYGLDRAELNVVLNELCVLHDKLSLSNEEEKALDVAIKCVTQITNRIADNKPLRWD